MNEHQFHPRTEVIPSTWKRSRHIILKLRKPILDLYQRFECGGNWGLERTFNKWVCGQPWRKPMPTTFFETLPWIKQVFFLQSLDLLVSPKERVIGAKPWDILTPKTCKVWCSCDCSEFRGFVKTSVGLFRRFWGNMFWVCFSFEDPTQIRGTHDRRAKPFGREPFLHTKCYATPWLCGYFVQFPRNFLPSIHWWAWPNWKVLGRKLWPVWVLEHA